MQKIKLNTALAGTKLIITAARCRLETPVLLAVALIAISFMAVTVILKINSTLRFTEAQFKAKTFLNEVLQKYRVDCLYNINLIT